MVEGAAAEAAENWSERKTSEGRRFYYNSVTKQRTWKLPPALDKHPLVRASSRKKKQRSVSVGPRERPISDEGGGERGRVTTKGSSTGPSGRQHRAVDDEGFSYRPDAVDQEYEEEEFKPIIKNLVIKQKIAAPMEVADPIELRTAIANLTLALPAAAARGDRRKSRSVSMSGSAFAMPLASEPGQTNHLSAECGVLASPPTPVVRTTQSAPIARSAPQPRRSPSSPNPRPKDSSSTSLSSQRGAADSSNLVGRLGADEEDEWL